MTAPSPTSQDRGEDETRIWHMVHGTEKAPIHRNWHYLLPPIACESDRAGLLPNFRDEKTKEQEEKCLIIVIPSVYTLGGFS